MLVPRSRKGFGEDIGDVGSGGCVVKPNVAALLFVVGVVVFHRDVLRFVLGNAGVDEEDGSLVVTSDWDGVRV